MAHTLLVRIAAVGAICSLGLIDTCTHNGEAAITAAQQSKLPALEPGQVREDILPAGTVISTAHYQAMLEMRCEGKSCAGEYPGVGNKQLLIIRRLSCILRGNPGSTAGIGAAELVSSGAVLASEFLPAEYSTPDGGHILNSAVELEIGPRQHIHVGLHLLAGDTATQALCTATGTLETLQ